ncbi:MAG: DUF2062 domain-containing protein [Bacteroidetes bacterium]|nr:DUF2062 domain-containing protein [Bacteroidota bacterium]
MTSKASLDNLFEELRCCVLIPTYNNEKTLEKVLTEVLTYTHHVLVVNDGSTDSTKIILERFKERVFVVSYEKNQGKGFALQTGFRFLVEKKYRYAISIDSDGQHYPSDLEKFLRLIKEKPDSLIIGARNMEQDSVPGKSSFGNKFSNFWFHLETGIKMPDTQSGYRLYPIEKLKPIFFHTQRFEFEIEVIVRAAWENIPVIPVAVGVFYPNSKDRVSHFRPTKDFLRISVLNSVLVVLAVFWYRPKKFFLELSLKKIKNYLYTAFADKNESILKKTLSVSVGIFFGLLPIWGYQLIAAIAIAYLFKLNKAIVIIAANISLPPMIPFILYSSLKVGELITHTSTSFSLSDVNFNIIKNNMQVYLYGSCVLAITVSVAIGLLTFLGLFIKKKIVKKNT